MELSSTYKPGDVVIPKPAPGNETPQDDEDRRMVEEVREMSLRDLGVGSHERRGGRGTRERSRDRPETVRRWNEGIQTPTSSNDQARNGRYSQPRTHARQIEHQSSLRSLLSASDVESADIEEEILRQIVDEGLLDGIDLTQLNATQEDELSDRLADAYRHRQRERAQRERARATEIRSSDRTGRRSRVGTREPEGSNGRHHTRSHSASQQTMEPPRPPSSHSRLPDTRPAGSGTRRRTFSDSRRQTSPSSANSRRASAEVQSQAARSANDVSSRPQSSHDSPSSPTEVSARRAPRNESERRQPSGNWRRAAARTFPAGTQSRSRTTASSEQGTAEQRHIVPRTARAIASAASASLPGPSNPEAIPRGQSGIQPSQPSPSLEAPSTALPAHMVSSTPTSGNTRDRPPRHLEPSISCERCGQTHIEYDLHAYCGICKDGNYNLCSTCYRRGLGCLHWFGFGHTAWPRYERLAPDGGYPPSYPLPHVLVGHRYLRPSMEVPQSVTGDTNRRLTSEDPLDRLQSGGFCDICSTYANECYWKCELCNEGEWGFCNRCVNQGRCCTHPLLPVAHKSTLRFRGSTDSQTSSPHTVSAPAIAPRTASIIPGLPSSGDFQPLTFSTKCDICRYPIQPSNTRFHCPQCNEGDYDICTNCYLKLIVSKRITKDNGEKGWRRCLRGHRMVVVGFQDGDAGQSRIVVKDLVGGHALKDEGGEGAATGSWSWPNGRERQSRTVSKQVASGVNIGEGSPLLARFPPDGGVGMRVRALWSYYPAEGVSDELMFPKGAEIREVADINGDWFWGCYSGASGLFPGNHVRILDNVTM